MTTTTRPLGAQISHMLKDRGVEVIFGIPGVHNQEMYRGIEEAGLTHVLARHEQGAGFMADGYARATGRPGVAYVISGPGVTNILTPLGQAYSDSVPVLAISSCLDETDAHRGQLHQMLDQRGAAATVCDWSEEAGSADAAYQLVDRALAEFQTQRPRPKHLQVPISLLEGPASAAPKRQPVADLPTDGHAAAGIIALHLSTAQAPLFIFGGGAMGGPAREVAERFGAACFTTYAGDGLAAGYALNFGCYLGRPSSVEVIAQADVVVVFGSELSESDLWRADLGRKGTLIRVDRDTEVLTDRHHADVPLCADAPAVLRALLKTPDVKPAQSWDAKTVARRRAAWRQEADAERPGIVPVLDVLKSVLPDDTCVFSDMTQFAYVAKEVWDLDPAGQWHHPTGFGTLGYALPAAIGGAIGRPGLPTVAMVGDYGFQYTLQELGVAVELGLTLPIIVWDNGKLKEIEDSMVAAQIAPNSVIARNPDFLALARAYGAAAVAPKGADALRQAVRDALGTQGPTLIYLTADSL